MIPDPDDLTPETPFKIELAEVPALVPRKAPEPVPEIPLVPNLLTPMPEEEPPAVPSSWTAVKEVVGRGFFDPFEAFEHKIDWQRFRKSQLFLILASLFGPLLFLLVTSFIVAVVYQAVAALNSINSPNTFYELALYPFVYVLAKKYWIAYMALPMVVLVLGWLWAACTAWNLARDSREDFTKMFCILAMLGAMFGPFTMFPFVRMVALGILIWYTSKRMAGYFTISFFHLAKRGGIFLLAFIALHSWSERKVEGFYAEPSELSANLSAFFNKKQKLEWPSFFSRKTPSYFQTLTDNLNSFDPDTRARALDRANVMINNGRETPEDRLKVARIMADMGSTPGMLFLAKAYQTGLGVRPDLAVALEWMQKASEANPKNQDFVMERANLLIQGKRVLDGKHLFVTLAKENINSLGNIAAYLRKTGLDAPDNSLIFSIQQLYRQDPSTQYVTTTGSYTYNPSNPRSPTFTYAKHITEAPSARDNLLERLAGLDRDGSQWFFRALITEYGNANFASPETYGESATAGVDTSKDSLDLVDPVALNEAGDHCRDLGDVVKARAYWAKAAAMLDSDKRLPNAKLYLKLAQSYGPAKPGTSPAANRDAIRYYLGYLLLTDYTGSSIDSAVSTLQDMGLPLAKDVKVSSLEFLALCTRYDVPEAWVMTGCNCLGATKNLARARECFQKAKALGYRGPAVNQLDGGGPKAS